MIAEAIDDRNHASIEGVGLRCYEQHQEHQGIVFMTMFSIVQSSEIQTQQAEPNC